jgi:hypothetical protein
MVNIKIYELLLILFPNPIKKSDYGYIVLTLEKISLYCKTITRKHKWTVIMNEDEVF